MLVNNVLNDKILSLTITKRIVLCRQSVEVLFFILETHGPRCFDHLWMTDKPSKPAHVRNKRSVADDDDDELQQLSGLEQFDDFFAFVKSVLETHETAAEREKQAEVNAGIYRKNAQK